MDFSTIPMSDILKEQLLDEYNTMKNRYKELQDKNEELKQQNHNILLEKSRMVTIQEDLSNELEGLVFEHSKHTKELEEKHQNILDSVNSNSGAKYEQYEAEIELLNTELEALKSTKTLSESKSCSCKQEQLTNLKIINDLQDDIRTLKLDHENELIELKNIIDNISRSKQQLEEQYEMLQESLMCAKQNLAAKKEESSVLQEQLQEAQEEVCALKAEATSLKNSSEEHGSKGNSLFAEVNDRRVRIELILKEQNERFSQMRLEHAQSKRENNAIRSQVIILEKTLASFKNTIGAEDKYRIEQYQKNIRELEESVKDYQRKLKSRDDFIGNEFRQKSEGWIDAFMKDSNEQLKKKQELFEAKCLQKAFSDDALRMSNKELNKWKYNAMKNEAKVIQLELQLQEMKATAGYDQISKATAAINTTASDTQSNNVTARRGTNKTPNESNTVIKRTTDQQEVQKITTKENIEPTTSNDLNNIKLHSVAKEISSTLKNKSKTILKQVNNRCSIYDTDVKEKKSVRFTNDTFSPKPSNLKNKRMGNKKGPLVPSRIIPSPKPRFVESSSYGIVGNSKSESSKENNVDVENECTRLSVNNVLQESISTETNNLVKLLDENVKQESNGIEKNNLECISLQDELLGMTKTTIDCFEMIKKETNEEVFVSTKKINHNEETIMDNFNMATGIKEKMNIPGEIICKEESNSEKNDNVEGFTIFEDSICVEEEKKKVDERSKNKEQSNSEKSDNVKGFTIFEDSICIEEKKKVYELPKNKEQSSSEKSDNYDCFTIFEDSIRIEEVEKKVDELPKSKELSNSEKSANVEGFTIFEDSIRIEELNKKMDEAPNSKELSNSEKSGIVQGFAIFEDSIHIEEVKKKVTTSEEPPIGNNISLNTASENLIAKDNKGSSGGTRRMPLYPTRIIPSAWKKPTDSVVEDLYK